MENELSQIVDALPGLVWTALPDGRLDFVNRRWCEYTGLQRDEALGQQWHTAIHSDDLPELLARWRSIPAAAEPREMEARLRRGDGEYRWFLLRISRLSDASGQLVKWCGLSIDIDDRRRGEDALRAREDHYRLIADSVPALIAFMTPAGAVESVNRHVLEYLGTTLEELQKWPTADIVHPEDLPAVIAAWMRAVDTGKPYDIEHRIRRADGIYRWFQVRGLPLRDAAGNVARWYVLETDIEDRKRAEGLLADEKRILEMVARGHPMPEILEALCQLVESTASGSYCSVVLVDPTGARLEHGAAPSLPASFITSIIGRPVNVDSGPCAMSAYLNEQVIAADIKSETRWAAYEWCPMALAHGLQACWSTPISSTAGKVLGAFAIYYEEPRTPTPIHQTLIEQFTRLASIAIEREQSQESLTRALDELTRSEHRLQTIIDTIPNSVWSAGPDGVTAFWNKRWKDYAGFSPADRNGDWSELIHPDDFTRLHDAINATVPHGRPGQVESRMRRFDGEYRWFQSRWEPLRDETGAVVNWYGANTDIDDAKRAEEALGKVRSDLARVARVTSLGALTASITHEVSQPLSGILTNASTCLRMLTADPPNVDGALETVRRTIRDSNRASEVITRLRALFSKKDPTTESVDLNEATREVIALSMSELQRGRVILRPEFSDDLPHVTGDRVQLQQVILNLLLNASDAMSGVHDRPRQLMIRTERDEADQVRMTVQDAGVGVEPQSMDKLFEAFYTTKSGGMGIGLSVSRSIIESHRGRLWAAPNDGPGATFSFSIPRRSPVAAGDLRSS